MEILDNNSLARTSPVTYASFGSRLGASLIDFLVTTIPMGSAMYYGITQKSLMIMLLGILVAALYKPLMEGIYGATLGKMAVGIVMVDDNNDILDLNQSFLKNAIYLISSAVGILSSFWLFGQDTFLESEGLLEYMAINQNSPYQVISSLLNLVTLISCMSMLGSDKKQTLHDRIANTYCVEKDSL